MNQHFMIDIETTGLAKEAGGDDVLQIGLLEVSLDPKSGLYTAGESYSRFLGTPKRPRDSDNFALAHMTEMYDHCNALPYNTEPSSVREEILGFFERHGYGSIKNKPRLIGKNLSDFDVPFCENRGYLQRSDRHYRLYELTGTINSLIDVAMLDQDKDRYAFLDWAYVEGLEAMEYAGISTPNWSAMNADFQEKGGRPRYKDHEAIYDCHRQLAELNGFLILGRMGAALMSDKIHRFREIKQKLDAKRNLG